MKPNWIDIFKKAVGVTAEFGCIELCSRGIDRITDKYTNNVSKTVMRVGGFFLGGYLGSKASEYANEAIDKGVKIASKYVKLPVDEDEKDEKTEE